MVFILEIGPAVYFDATMGLDMEFDDDMNDRNSQVYLDTAAMATNAMAQILSSTQAEVDLDDIVWKFIEGEGSVIATAEHIAMSNTNMADIEEFLQGFDLSTVSGLQSLNVQSAGNFKIKCLDENAASSESKRTIYEMFCLIL